MAETFAKTCSKSDLERELADFRITASPLNRQFHFASWLSTVDVCRVVKVNNRRRVYYLQTDHGGFFLKRSSLVRSKDRWRHLLLPRRRWAEWRNLHRLYQARVPAARPLAKGQSKRGPFGSYFILTEAVPGVHIPFDSDEHARRLGRYTAFLHRHKVYHADLNRKNFLLSPSGESVLIDVQEIYFPLWLPRPLRINNLGRIIFNLCALDNSRSWVMKFLQGYNQNLENKVNSSEAVAAARRHQNRRYRSRSKRCCRNSTEFERVQSGRLRGFKRRSFAWEARDLQQAREKGRTLKGSHVISYRGVCLKIHPRKRLHLNRCLASWKMSRSLEVRGIAVPRSLAYYEFEGQRYYLAELLDDGLPLNAYLSALTGEHMKRRALKKLALWLRRFHDTDIWQRDFKSSNILCRNSDYFMVDLDGVRIRRLGNRHKIYNLAQLNASVSNAVSIRDRLRFYSYYAEGFRLNRQQRRAVYREVWRITRKKNTKIYDLDFSELVASEIKAGPTQFT